MALEFTLNGKPVRVEDADPHQSLLQWLRQQGLTGTKEGCAEGECGACAVAMLDAEVQPPALRAVNSCLVPLGSVAGRTLISIEGVAGEGGALHPVQRALVDSGGSQCGYCTPGFAISLYCEYYRAGRSGYDPEAISGNLCRCTGYRPIIDAAKQLPSPATDDVVLTELRATPPLRAALDVQVRGRRYIRPRSLQHALQCAAQDDDATWIAGGTDLMVYANLRGRRFSSLIALDAVPELARCELSDSELVLGAGVPLSQLEARLQAWSDAAPAALSQLWPLFSSRLIRNRATLGGNLATASPIGDAAPVLLALEASLTLASAGGTRKVALADFFLDYRSTLLQPGELIASVHIPRPQAPIQRFYKVSKRKLDDISTVAGAFCLELDEAKRVRRLRVAYGGIAATPLRASELEQQAQGQPWSAQTVQALRPALDALGTPLGDLRGSAAYRRALRFGLLEKFWADSARQLSLASAASPVHGGHAP